MKIKFLQNKRALRAVLLFLLLCVVAMTKAQTENITFADDNVKAICVTNWDTDGDGELNQAEAAAVTSLDGVFMFDGNITSFDELQFFTGLTSFGEDEFNSCTSLASVTIPNAVTSIGSYAFSDCSSLTSMTSYACTPPAWATMSSIMCHPFWFSMCLATLLPCTKKPMDGATSPIMRSLNMVYAPSSSLTTT